MSTYKRPGSPYYTFDFQWNGDRFRGSTKKTAKREAERVERRERDKVKRLADAPQQDGPPEMTLYAAAERYFDERAFDRPSANDTDYQLENLARLIGKDTLLSAIDDSVVANFVRHRRGERSRNAPKEHKGECVLAPATVNRETQLLRRVFRRAAQVWRVKIGDMPNWSQHILPEPDERTRELSAAEEKALFNHLPLDMHPLARFCLISGVRMQNAIDLAWRQVDDDAEIIWFKVKSILKDGKTHVIPLTDQLRPILQGERGNHPRFVFTYECRRNRHGQRREGERYPFTKSGWGKRWRAALAEAGVEDFRFHDTRHTSATRTLRASGNLKIVQRMLAHANIATTAKYAHVQIDDVREAMQKVPAKSPALAAVKKESA
jgi:integrase